MHMNIHLVTSSSLFCSNALYRVLTWTCSLHSGHLFLCSVTARSAYLQTGVQPEAEKKPQHKLENLSKQLIHSVVQ